MKTLRNTALSLLVALIPACGQQMVEFPDDGSAGKAGAGHSGSGGSSSSGGSSNASGGKSGAGRGGTADNGGSGGDGAAGNASAGKAGHGPLGGAGEGGAGGEGGANGPGGMAGMGGENSALLQVASTNPEDADLAVAINKTIEATFNELMDPATVPGSFTLAGPGTTAVSGTVTVTGSVASFVPSANLAPGTTFTATIGSAASALSGDVLPDDYVWSFTTGTEAAQLVPQLPVPLGSASNFAILASAAITNIPTSDITGDVGLTPDAGSNISGFSMPATCPEVTGIVYAVDASGPACAVINPTLLLDAKTDAGVAFVNANAAARGTPQAISGDLNGLTLYPGLYESGSSIQISPGGFLYLDAQGDENAVFIIRSATSITTSAGSEVVLTKVPRPPTSTGPRVARRRWDELDHERQRARGTAVSLLTGADLEGRALNQGASAAAISLDSSTITVPTP